MKFAPIVLIAGSSLVAAQQPQQPPANSGIQAQLDTYNEEAWLLVPFEERMRLFEAESRDSVWAPDMEQAIAAKVAELDRPLEQVIGAETCGRLPLCQEEMPSVQLASVECRSMLCRIEMHWPPGTFRAVIGQQVSFLYGIGIDHQGEVRSSDDGNQYRVEMIVRRRT